MRGLMHSLRRTAHFYHSRVNVLSPWYVRTSILPESAYEHVEAAGVEFATAEDGRQLLLRIVSDSRIQGRQLFLAPRKWAASGGLDLGIDDFEGDEFLQQVQREQLLGAPVEEGLFFEGRW
ncbi:hypothetical protein WHR41_08251 [Cladosporium halotolerans]|uniref:Uncharacterized protein n=1 Tax=Cladosporium halotolerans TaxID=1052096 RepID=A0AB34KEH6_9PEZI